MSLNKTRKRAIAELQQKLDRRTNSHATDLIVGYTTEEIAQMMRGLEKFCRAAALGLSAFIQTFAEILRED
ncbi:hypothetical protein [Streptococcus sp. 19428wC2_LYSM12]|uniref:hypothetical protein n=1 Tax=Streptococcus sp. 19428wC2_LYSM12 TaxID=2782470 RepID=UPI00261F2A58|nr:hypothetical protein [Streptococcus sp. 19428wC2_LYSM12]